MIKLCPTNSLIFHASPTDPWIPVCLGSQITATSFIAVSLRPASTSLDPAIRPLIQPSYRASRASIIAFITQNNLSNKADPKSLTIQTPKSSTTPA